MKSYIWIVLILLGMSSINSREIDINSALDLAIENNIGLKRAALELNGKARNKSAAYNVFYPKVSGRGTLIRSNTAPLEPASDMNLALGYEASFNFTPGLFHAVTMVKKDYQLGVISFNQAKSNLEVEVRQIFYNMILLQDQLKLLEDSLETMKGRYNLTKLNYNAGLASELELLKVRVSYENFKPELNSVRNLYSSTMNSFKSMLGLDYGEALTVSGVIEPEIISLTTEEAMAMAIRNNYDMNILNKSFQLLDAQRDAQFSRSFYPMLNLSYSFQRLLNDPFGESRIKEENFNDDSGNFSVSLLYSFNALLPNSAERLALKQIDQGIRDMHLQKKALLDGLELQVINYIKTLHNSMEIQEGLKLTATLAEKSLNHIELAYESGTATLLEVENAENEFHKAALELLKEKYVYNSNKIKLEAIISPQ